MLLILFVLFCNCRSSPWGTIAFNLWTRVRTRIAGNCTNYFITSVDSITFNVLITLLSVIADFHAIVFQSSLIYFKQYVRKTLIDKRLIFTLVILTKRVECISSDAVHAIWRVFLNEFKRIHYNGMFAFFSRDYAKRERQMWNYLCIIKMYHLGKYLFPEQ